MTNMKIASLFTLIALGTALSTTLPTIAEAHGRHGHGPGGVQIYGGGYYYGGPSYYASPPPPPPPPVYYGGYDYSGRPPVYVTPPPPAYYGGSPTVCFHQYGASVCFNP